MASVLPKRSKLAEFCPRPVAKVEAAWTAACSLIAVSSACADTGTTSLKDIPQDKSLIRNQYVNSAELPDGIAYAQILGQLSSIDQVVAKRVVSANMGFDEASAESFLAQLLDENEQLSSITTTAIRNICCNPGVPRVSTDAEVANVFRAIEDMQRIHEEAAYARFKISLAPEEAEKLGKWVANAKPDIVHIDFDYTELFERKNLKGLEVLQSTCSQLKALGENDE